MRHLSEKTDVGFEYFVGAQSTVEVFRVLCCALLHQCCVQRPELVEVIRVVSCNVTLDLRFKSGATYNHYCVKLWPSFVFLRVTVMKHMLLCMITRQFDVFGARHNIVAQPRSRCNLHRFQRACMSV